MADPIYRLFHRLHHTVFRISVQAGPRLYEVCLINMEDKNSSLTLHYNHNQQSNVPNAEYTHDSEDSDDTQSDDDITWSPGDGVCPTTAQFNSCCETKLNEWEKATSIDLGQYDTLSRYARAFLDLLKDVPPFFHRPPEHVNLTGRPKAFLILRSSLLIQTTGDSNCNQTQKPIDYLQCIGSPKPVTYRTNTETQLHTTVSISGNVLRSGYFTSIALAWSYIISCYWVEILQQAGEESQILHNGDTQIEDSFWDIVTQGCWVAHVKKQKGIFYSPWMLRREGATEKRVNWTPVSSNSSLAFDILSGFCASEGLQAEFLIGLASVLILTSRDIPPPKFAPPMIPVTSTLPPPRQDKILNELFQSINRCIFLSSTQDAMDSLLCSAFFDPCIPCNLVGASSLGIRKAISTANAIDNQKLLDAIAYMKPHLCILWTAAVCNDQANSLLNMALYHLPPISLVAAFLTNMIHSFLQVRYCLDDLEKSIVPRANEFQTSYFCRSDISVPWSPAPPFGATPVKNLSLEVRAHFAHQHRPVSWMICWILKDSGERIPASKNHESGFIQVDSICNHSPIGQANEQPDPERTIADEQSEVATSRLFNWHRTYDDGIWLDEGKGDIELVRRLQMHPWIIDPFDSLEDEPVKEPKQRELCVDGILRWNDEVEKLRQSGELIMQ